jgi:hypothetical protein
MVIHMMRIFALFFIFGFSGQVFANERKSIMIFNEFKKIILDKPLLRPTLIKRRTAGNDLETVTDETRITSLKTNRKKQIATGCITTSPYHHYSTMNSIGQAARVMAKNLNRKIETFAFQPRFSGLKGPKITIMRKDLERALVDKQGSHQEIFHNTHITATSHVPCKTGITYNDHLIFHNQIDGYDSDRAPLTRSSLKWRNELNLGQYFMGTFGTRHALNDNLNRDGNLNILDRPDPIRQDLIAFQYQNFNLERLMLSGFATPHDNLYIAGHIGYLEEMFAGAGAEILYRPFDENFAIGAEAWSTIKRIPYNGSIWATDDKNKQQSYLLNTWYDMPETPVSFGASAGRFLDGDMGVEFKTRWTPKPGWRLEGFTTLTNKADTTLQNDKTHLFAGLRATMPLGQFATLNDQARAEIDLTPFARDKGQRVDNPYPLYDYTDPWSTRNLYKYWNQITKQ